MNLDENNLPDNEENQEAVELNKLESRIYEELLHFHKWRSPLEISREYRDKFNRPLPFMKVYTVMDRLEKDSLVDRMNYKGVDHEDLSPIENPYLFQESNLDRARVFYKKSENGPPVKKKAGLREIVSKILNQIQNNLDPEIA